MASNDVSFVVSPSGTCGGATPEPPTMLPATVLGPLVTLTWLPPANAAADRYYLVGGVTPDGIDVIINAGAGTSFAALLPPGLYFVDVVAENACGRSERSRRVPVRVLP